MIHLRSLINLFVRIKYTVIVDDTITESDSFGFIDTVLANVSFAYLIQYTCEIYAVFSHDTVNT